MNGFNFQHEHLLAGVGPGRQPNPSSINTTSTEFIPNYVHSQPLASPSHDPRYSPFGDQLSLHESHHEDPHVAREDKRRRNTAASARFRVKKKQREQDLERRVSEFQDKNARLEQRVNQLEVENKWLKDLIVEKHRKPLSEFARDSVEHSTEDEEDEREPRAERRTGVGTQHQHQHQHHHQNQHQLYSYREQTRA